MGVAPDRLHLRPAGPADPERIAALHAHSWRRHYRGAYADDFLDGDLDDDRRAVWAGRLLVPHDGGATIVAEDDMSMVGFVHVIFDDDPSWGALIENLHVAYGSERSGIGTRLMIEAARAVIDRSATSGLYLWVLEQNVAAQAFYNARGGRRVEQAWALAPGGVNSRLNGSPLRWRYVWAKPTVLLADP
jgi:ribosomal protein S18 acetylase RimI-like enzyme